MRATGSNDLHIDVTVPTTALLGGVEGLALVVAQLAPHWMVASYAAVYVGVARAAGGAAGGAAPGGSPSPAPPGPARCNRRPRTCARTGWASRRSAVIRTRRAPLHGGDP